VFSSDGDVPTQSEGVPEVLHAAAPVEVRLRHCVAKALEGVAEDQILAFCQFASQDLGLIEFPLAPAQRVQRHAHHDVEIKTFQPGVLKTLGKELAQDRSEPHLCAVFEPMDEIARKAA
jgi:hypothetical protein